MAMAVEFGVNKIETNIDDVFEKVFGRKRYVEIYRAYLETSFIRALTPKEILNHSRLSSSALYPTLKEMVKEEIIKEIQLSGVKRYAINAESWEGRLLMLVLERLNEYKMETLSY